MKSPTSSGLTRLLRVIEEFRTLEPDLPAQTIHTFLLIARTQGITIRELQDRLGTSSASASRNVAFLSERHRLGKKGLNLVVAESDPTNLRTKVVKLTPAGRQVLERINFFMGEGND